MSNAIGIDVSVHNGKIDWTKVAAAGIKFVIIRAGYGNSTSQMDKRFVENITGALAAGLQVGIYWFSYADSVEDARREWAACKQVITPYKSRITLPVAFDYEYDSVNYYAKKHGGKPTNALINQMADAFLFGVVADGYKPLLYLNNDYRKNIFSAELVQKYPLWLADYTGAPDVPCAYQQTGSTGRVNGIAGNVDMNTAFESIAHTKVKSDTSGTVAIKRGAFYTAKFSGADNITVTAGTGNVVTVVPINRGADKLAAIVGLGKSGDATGIYTQAAGEQPVHQFDVKIV